MNMMTETTAVTAAATLPLARPKGMGPTSKRRSREEVMAAIPAILVGRGLPWAVAHALAGAVYDGYVQAYGGVPANAADVAQALATPKGKAALEALAARHLMAFNAAKAAEKVQVAPTPVAVAKAGKAKAVPTLKVLPPALHDALTGELRVAVQAYWRGGTNRASRAHGDAALDAVLRHIAEDCKAEGVQEFPSPYIRGGDAGRLIGGRFKENPIPGFWMKFIEGGGIDDRAEDYPPQRRNGPTYTRPAQPERTAEEAEAARLKRLKREQALEERRERDRAARAAARGKSGDGGGNKRGKKGK